MELLGSCLYQRSATAKTGPGDNTPPDHGRLGAERHAGTRPANTLILTDQGATRKVTGLGTALVRRFMDGDVLTAITIDPALEQSLVQDIRPAETGTQLIMD